MGQADRQLPHRGNDAGNLQHPHFFRPGGGAFFIAPTLDPNPGRGNKKGWVIPASRHFSSTFQ